MADRDPYPSYTIYDSPADFPGKFVIRKWLITGGPEPVPTDEMAVCETLEEAREFVPPGLMRFPRWPNDNPVIVEWWF